MTKADLLIWKDINTWKIWEKVWEQQVYTWDKVMALVSEKLSLTPLDIGRKNTSLRLYPERGGIITSLRLNGTEILYRGMLDETLFDPSKSVKWGIPILFPNAWPLTQETQDQTWYTLPQHGFARNHAWIPQKKRTQWQIQQRLNSKDIGNLYGYDFNGEITNTIILAWNQCLLEYNITNNSQTKKLPISYWLHPYFDVPKGEKEEIEWMFEWGEQIKNEIENWSNGGTTRLDIPADHIVKFRIPWIGIITIEVSDDFEKLWIWSLPRKDFVCVEPVQNHENGIITNPRIIQPWKSLVSSVKIHLDK